MYLAGTTRCGRRVGGASDPHLDLGCAPYVLYGVKYIDLVSLAPFSGSIEYGSTQPGQVTGGRWKPLHYIFRYGTHW